MIIVKTSLKEFPGKGIGLVAEEPIKKGQSVWTFNPIVDILLDEKDVPKEAREFYNNYAVESKEKEGELMLNTDNGRFINHSKNPNIKSIGFRKDLVAIRDINPGEEITIDYQEIDMNPLSFEDVEEKND